MSKELVRDRTMGVDITLEDARAIMAVMLEATINTPADKSNPMAQAPMAFAVTDTAGSPIYVVRMDGASALNVRVAINKAFTAVQTRRDTIDNDKLVKAVGLSLIDLISGEPRLTYIPGGVLIRDKNRAIVGAIGTSGRVAMAPMGDEELSRIGAKKYLELKAGD